MLIAFDEIAGSHFEGDAVVFDPLGDNEIQFHQAPDGAFFKIESRTQAAELFISAADFFSGAAPFGNVGRFGQERPDFFGDSLDFDRFLKSHPQPPIPFLFT